MKYFIFMPQDHNIFIGKLLKANCVPR